MYTPCDGIFTHNMIRTGSLATYRYGVSQ